MNPISLHDVYKTMIYNVLCYDWHIIYVLKFTNRIIYFP